MDACLWSPHSELFNTAEIFRKTLDIIAKIPPWIRRIEPALKGLKAKSTPST